MRRVSLRIIEIASFFSLALLYLPAFPLPLLSSSPTSLTSLFSLSSPAPFRPLYVFLLSTLSSDLLPSYLYRRRRPLSILFSITLA